MRTRAWAAGTLPSSHVLAADQLPLLAERTTGSSFGSSPKSNAGAIRSAQIAGRHLEGMAEGLLGGRGGRECYCRKRRSETQGLQFTLRLARMTRTRE